MKLVTAKIAARECSLINLGQNARRSHAGLIKSLITLVSVLIVPLTHTLMRWEENAFKCCVIPMRCSMNSNHAKSAIY